MKYSILAILLLAMLPTLAQEKTKFITNSRLIFGPKKERTASISAGDLDGDGDVDVAVANGRHWPGQNRIYFNNGKGKFMVSKALGLESATSYSTELADFDSDGDLDIAVGNDQTPNYIFFNDGKGNFTKGPSFGELYASTRNIIVADINSDSHPDILITNRGKTNEICINNGNGRFTNSISFGAKDDSTIDVEVADINKDGHPDLVLANRDSQPNFVYLNDGESNFIEKIPYGNGSDNTRSVAVADVNQDGHLDILTANVREPNVMYFGSDELDFSESVVFDQDSNRTSSIDLGDFNDDGLEDIVVGNFREPNAVFINKGQGLKWDKQQLGDMEFNTYDVLVHDVNNDGKLDIVESNSDEINLYHLNKTGASTAAKAGDFSEEGSFLVYRRQSQIGEESFQISTENDEIIVRSLQGENERGRISGVQAEMRLNRDLSVKSYSSRRIANEDTTSIFKMTRQGDSLTIWEKHFAPISYEAPERLFPLHSNMPAAMEIMLYHYCFRNDIMKVQTFPRGEVSITHKAEDVAMIAGEEVKLDRYVVEGINWGGRTIWLDKDKNLISIVKANTQIREIIKKGYEEALSLFIAGNVEEQVSALRTYTESLKEEVREMTALVGADLVDGVSDQTRKDMVVLIKDGKITEIGKKGSVRIPAEARMIDLSGKVIMPGLWDMHAHSNQVQWAPAYLAGGVTTIRDNGNEVDFATAFRDAIAKDNMLGPEILLAGMTDGPGDKGNGAIRARNEKEAREVVDMYIKNGYKQIKIYNSVEPEVLKVLAEEAHRRGVTVTGHIPRPVGSIQNAVDLGMDMLSHDRAVYSALFPTKTIVEINEILAKDLTISEERLSDAIDFLLENKITLDPTMNLRLITNTIKGDMLETVEPFAGRIAYELWEGKRFRKGKPKEVVEKQVAKYTLGSEIIGAFFNAGVPIVAGTDNAVPVFSLYLEIESYHKLAGLTPFQALQTATSIPARAMGMDSQTGTLEVGKDADIAILDENPLENISNIRTVRAVLSDGVYYESDPLWEAADFKPRGNIDLKK